MKSVGNRDIVQNCFQVLHVHVLLAAPLGARYMAQPRADQHQPSGNVPTTRVRRRISRFSRSMMAVSKDAPLRRSIRSVTSPEVVVRFSSHNDRCGSPDGPRCARSERSASRTLPPFPAAHSAFPRRCRGPIP